MEKIISTLSEISEKLKQDCNYSQSAQKQMAAQIDECIDALGKPTEPVKSEAGEAKEVKQDADDKKLTDALTGELNVSASDSKEDELQKKKPGSKK
jgi:hypothetical protein